MSTLQEILAGDYGGLYGEVVTADVYKMRDLAFTPTLVFDVGANIGIFSRYARMLWPRARIVAVEPNPDNCQMFRRFTPSSSGIHLIEAAIGRGQIYHGLTARNGSGETYLSAGLGYPADQMELALGPTLERSSVQAINLFELIAYCEPEDKTVLKMDCEGAENLVWSHGPSFDFLTSMDYIAMELHDYALTHEERRKVLDETEAGLRILSLTHETRREGVHMWAVKRP